MVSAPIWSFKSKILKKFKINGIDSERIIFAKRVSISQHLARHKLADLFLDTSNYNAIPQQ